MFLDVFSTYHTNDHRQLYYKLLHKQVSSFIIRILSTVSSLVRYTWYTFADYFFVTNGVKQGGTFTSDLCNVFVIIQITVTSQEINPG